MLNLWRLEGDESHDAAQRQTEHEGNEKPGHAGATLTCQPIAQRKLVGNQQFDGIEDHGVVDGVHDVRRDHFEVHADKGDGGDDLQGDDLPLPPQGLEVKGARFGCTLEVNVRLETHFARHLSTPSPASALATNPCRASSQ